MKVKSRCLKELFKLKKKTNFKNDIHLSELFIKLSYTEWGSFFLFLQLFCDSTYYLCEREDGLTTWRLKAVIVLILKSINAFRKIFKDMIFLLLYELFLKLFFIQFFFF